MISAIADKVGAEALEEDPAAADVAGAVEVAEVVAEVVADVAGVVAVAMAVAVAGEGVTDLTLQRWPRCERRCRRRWRI